MTGSRKNEIILIIKDRAKRGILKKISQEKKLINIKIFTLSELKKNYFFDYTKKATFYVTKKYNVRPEIAEIYLNNIYYIKDIENGKIKFLKELKEDLESQNLLIKNELFKDYLKGKTIYLYNLENIDEFYNQIFEELRLVADVKTVEEDNNESIKELYKANDKEEEVAFVANEIVKLIKKGIDINHIKLANVQNDYIFTLKKTFKEFNIPLELDNTSSPDGTSIVKRFKELYNSNIESTLKELKSFVKDKNDEKLYKKLLDIVNDYVWIDDYENVKELIFNDIKKISLPTKPLKNAVRAIDFMDEIIMEDDYIFLINFNQGIMPSISKDEEYLNDAVRRELKISTSIDLNTKKTHEVQKRIKNIRHLVVTYSAHNLTSELYISNAYDGNIFDEKNIKIDFENSHNYNKRKLISLKDENKKFGSVTDELLILNNHYKEEEYDSYDNSFKGINLDKLNSSLNNHLTLSYSSMNTYYQCSFRYYLEYILKMNKFEDTFQTVIGNIFHKILSECFNENYNFDEAWNASLENEKYEFSISEKFFIDSLKDELLLVINTIKRQMESSSLKKALYEKEIVIPVGENTNITFKGFIDKIVYDEFNGETIVAIIDYKTGNPELNLDNAIYGLEMQLPVYIYLVKNSNEIKNVRIGGFYLQKILNNIESEEKRIESLKLQGYSNSDLNVLEKVDNTYMNSEVIKSLKMTNSGFSHYSKVLSDETMDKLSNIVENKIKEASNNITNGKFDINPKQVGDKLLGCKFCKYKDICYVKNANIVKLKKVTKDEFLGGENNAIMD